MIKTAFKESLPGIILSFAVPALIGYFVVPLPASAAANAMSSGIGGAISAGLTSVITLTLYMKKNAKKE